MACLEEDTSGDPNFSHLVEENDPDTIQAMIDVSADYLESLRTQCATSNSLTQHEIRHLESKLVRMFSELLVTKSKLPVRVQSSGVTASESELQQWLHVVGLCPESLNVCLTKLTTLEQLLEKTDIELKNLLMINPTATDDEVRRLTIAIRNLRLCRESLLTSSKIKDPENLFWDSWDRQILNHKGNIGSFAASSSPKSRRNIIKHNQSKQSPSKSSKLIRSPPEFVGSNLIQNNNGNSSMLIKSISPPCSPLPFATSEISESCKNFKRGTSSHNSDTPSRRMGTPPRRKKINSFPHHSSQSIFQLSSVSSPNNADEATLAAVASPCSSSSQDSIATATTPPIEKSKSHESQFQDTSFSQCYSTLPSTPTYKISSINNSLINSQQNCINATLRARSHTDSCPDSFTSVSSDIFTDNSNNLTVPRSPCTPIVSLGMGHTISHRFTKGFKMMSTCDLCQKQMFIGLKCKECKYRCHKECEPSVPPSCGLPIEFVDEFKKTLRSVEGFLPPQNTSPNLSTLNRNSGMAYLPQGRRQKSQISGQHHDSSSPASSCNSSSPSSPALYNQHQHSQGSSGSGVIFSSGGGSSSASLAGGAGSTAVATPSSFYKNSNQFNFPDVTITSAVYNKMTTQTLYSAHDADFDNIIKGNNEQEPQELNPLQILCLANNAPEDAITSTINIFSDKATKQKTSDPHIEHGNPPLSELFDTHKSNDSDKTVSVSGSTTDSDKTPVRLDSTEDVDSRQNSSLKEWDIPYSDIMLLEKIGKGRFGTVHRAIWHGDVAVKLLKEDYLDDENMLEAFKLEVANFKKTRHENLVLFMGACMNPPYLAIVTSLCKGNTLYTFVHARREKFTIARTTIVAKQITQGMSYLHARGILHRDLRTKNIFVENGKVIITDFGLFSSTNLLYTSAGIGIPSGWLCYLAPEIICSLTATQQTDETLRFSEASDVYSFGTVYYELLSGEFPFKAQPPEAIIWQVGRGMKQTLANLQTSREVKDILMLCWSFQADDRPDFPKLLTLIERFPKKQRLIRSPSHPVKLSKSAESVF